MEESYKESLPRGNDNYVGAALGKWHHLVVIQDDLGNLHVPASGPSRIVSLVPSITELLCDLGLGKQLVGRTGFCIHPRDIVRAIPKIGGTKDVDIEAIRRLEPTHLIVNIDENRRETVDELSQFVPAVVVTHPRGPDDNLALFRLLGAIFRCEHQAESLCAAYRTRRDHHCRAISNKATESVLYLIWRDPWMTVSRDTYISRMLALFGWVTWQPENDARRYPSLQLSQCQGAIDRVLLSSEPFPFREKHLAEILAALPGIPVELIDGEMVSWYGSRAIAGIDYLADFIRCAGSDRLLRTTHG
jgi:hypothetical protein